MSDPCGGADKDGEGCTCDPPFNVAEFLLARIAEDEAETMRGWGWPDRYNLLAAKIRDECEAKRRIIERYRFACDQADAHKANHTDDDGWEKIAGALQLDMQSLAAVYADHPDYRRVWKP